MPLVRHILGEINNNARRGKELTPYLRGKIIVLREARIVDREVI